MTTSGLTNFDLDLNELVEEAFERAGSELRSGYDLRTARRSLNLMFIEWQNRGLNMWTMVEGEIPLVKGVSTYDLPADTVDLLEHTIRTGIDRNQTDVNLNRISITTYAHIPNKNATGQPNQIFIERRSGATDITGAIRYPRVNLFPVPDADDKYTLVYWRMRRIENAGDGMNTQDVPFRFLPCLVAGLAWYISMKIPEGVQRSQVLKELYAEQWALAAEEDREKAAVYLKPRLQR